MKPMGPKRKRPPRVPTRISRSGIFASFPTNVGRKDIIDRAHHGRAPDQEQGRGQRLPGDVKIKNAWHPNERGPDAGNDRQDCHDRSPKRGAFNSRDPKAEAGQRSLNHPDDERALDRGARDRGELLQNAALVFVIERGVVENFLHDRVPIAEEIKHRVEHDEEIEQEDRGAGGDAGNAGDQKSARRLRHVAGILHQLRLIRHVTRERREIAAPANRAR